MKTNFSQLVKTTLVVFMTLCSVQLIGQSMAGSTTNVGNKAVKSAVSSDTHTIKLVVIGGWNIIRSFEYFDGSAWVSVDDNDAAVSYTNFGLHGAGFHESETAGATAQFTFTGTGIRLKGNTASYNGTAKIYIDNIYQQDVTFNANPGAWDMLIYEKLNLIPVVPVVPPASHTIKLVVNSGWNIIRSFEFFDGSAWVSVDDNDAAVSYTNFGLHGAGFHESETPGATAQYTFSGTGIRLYGNTADYNGTAKIYIDNVYQQDITFRTNPGAWDMLIYEKTGLSSVAGLPVVKTITASSVKDALPAANAIDELATTDWKGNQPSISTPQWLQLEYFAAQTFNQVILTSNTQYETRDPYDWKIEASNNGTAWTELHNEVLPSGNFSLWGDEKTLGSVTRSKPLTFNFTNSTAYVFYRLVITRDNSSSSVQLAEIAFRNSTTTSVVKPISEKAKIYVQAGKVVVDLSDVKGSANVTLIDVKGAVVKAVKSNGNEKLNLGLQNKGIYIVRIQSSNKTYNQKVALY